ncbi:hypothetical protein PFICI_05937 [Pestalotiopsis fici W106-1]|uniref:EKC/KEOPS complex subunit BUD32 n=1 Tax=Pestalotiopsis fici (strain W106-1 / CGMCC3.15140) TaxID=1229662 RepID=W3XFS0_PESFW|nr:uncharacterized protein PFICI_05937 [Pestalotiopsis fici W106-1]ETS84061.1 hypothetical protein PFICI_05937 [Pestalotiopsis fici W106-1]
MHPLPYHGSSSNFYQAEPEVVLKAPMRIRVQNENRKALEEQNSKAIDVERRILEVLGKHPRIVPYLRFDQSGIHLAKAKLGDLQNYIDSYHTELHPLQRYKICEQVTEAVVHVHERGVIHSDLRLENVLVEQVNESSVSVWLCDFGGSTCDQLGLDGGHLPDTPFFDPRLRWLSTQATDIFSLGSISILLRWDTGHL